MPEPAIAKLKKFGRAVRAARVAQGWSQEQFAERCDLHRTYVGHIERAEANVSFENITKVARALGLTITELCRRAGI
jgi:transcriptional regulator with XRE-family HTH domain